MDKIDWSKAPEGAQFYCAETEECSAAWWKYEDGRWWRKLADDDYDRWSVETMLESERRVIQPRPQPDNKEGDSVEWEPGVDLPPVGEWVYLTLEGESVEVVVHGVGQKFCGRDQQGYIGIFDSSLCEPIKSHRDKVIEAAVKNHNIKRSYRESMEHLYDLGMLKLPGDEQ